MSDPVIVAIITGGISFVSTLFTLLNTYMLARNSRAIVSTKDAIITLEKNTNSIKDALVKVTGEAEFAKGLKIGQEQRV